MANNKNRNKPSTQRNLSNADSQPDQVSPDHDDASSVNSLLMQQLSYIQEQQQDQFSALNKTLAAFTAIIESRWPVHDDRDLTQETKPILSGDHPLQSGEQSSVVTQPDQSRQQTQGNTRQSTSAQKNLNSAPKHKVEFLNFHPNDKPTSSSVLGSSL